MTAVGFAGILGSEAIRLMISAARELSPFFSWRGQFFPRSGEVFMPSPSFGRRQINLLNRFRQLAAGTNPFVLGELYAQLVFRFSEAQTKYFDNGLD
jgi:hypothetical protein